MTLQNIITQAVRCGIVFFGLLSASHTLLAQSQDPQQGSGSSKEAQSLFTPEERAEMRAMIQQMQAMCPNCRGSG